MLETLTQPGRAAATRAVASCDASGALRTQPASPVSSFTEWGKLREVILGSHYDTKIEFDTSVRLLFHDQLQYLNETYPAAGYSIRKEYLDEREEDMDAIAALLTSMGVKVRRPKPLAQVQRVVTPYWEALTKACDNPRDQSMIVGDRIIETSCCARNRYFENDLLKPLFHEYWLAGARWICAPRPTLTDDSLDRCYAEGGELAAPETTDIGFDGAQCLRFGRDILFNVSNRNHLLGLDWLQRELGSSFRVHAVRITDNHLDGMMMPLRPGKLLVCDQMMGKRHLLPRPLQSWDMVLMSDTDMTTYRVDDILLASTRIGVNVLSLDAEHVLVNREARATIRALEEHGFNPIPVRLRHSRVFAGGLHCVSLDVRRDDQAENYFD